MKDLIEFLNYKINTAIRWLSDGWNEYLRDAERDKVTFFVKSILYPFLIIFGFIALYGLVVFYWKFILFILVLCGLISALRYYLAKHYREKNIIADNYPPDEPYFFDPDGK